LKNSFITVLLLATVILSSCFSEEKRINPSFNLTITTLKEILSDQDERIQERILENPERFLQLADVLLSKPEELFYLADKNHAVTKEQAPSEVVKPSDYGISVTRQEREISSLVIEPLQTMTAAAAEEDLDIVFASGYRPYEYQEMLYNRYVDQLGQEEADRVSARPGTSQHQLGTAIDFGSISDEYALTEEGKWLKEHAGEYGFSLSYPDGFEEITGYKWECWHYRYITIEGVEMQVDFFLDLQQYFIEFWDLHKDSLKEARRQ